MFKLIFMEQTLNIQYDVKKLFNEEQLVNCTQLANICPNIIMSQMKVTMNMSRRWQKLTAQNKCVSWHYTSFCKKFHTVPLYSGIT